MIDDYRILEGEEQQAVIDEITKAIPTLSKAGSIDRWEKGWQENLNAYRKSGDVADLRPKYIRKGKPLRLYGKFILPANEDAEANWYAAQFGMIAKIYFRHRSGIVEFGSGSGHNLAFLTKLFPEKHLFGHDWSWAAVELATEVGAFGRHFDFFNPVIANFPDNSAVFTVGALEQTGTNWLDFIEELIRAKPAICVHLEPIVEWYDPNNPVDATAIEAHNARGFWRGFWPYLKRARANGKVEILEARRTGFGSMFIEGYSLLVWRPK